MASERFRQIELFVIGTSAGGVDILSSILPAFTKTSRFKVAVVIHMSPDGPNLVPSLMSDRCNLTVKEAEAGELLLADHIYIAPPDYHLLIEPNKSLSLSTDEQVNFSRPSIDVMFDTSAYAYGDKVAGILLTGANDDGAKGLQKIKEYGGLTIVQEPSDAEYETMPASAIKLFRPDLVMTKDEIVRLIREICDDRRPHA